MHNKENRIKDSQLICLIVTRTTPTGTTTSGVSVGETTTVSGSSDQNVGTTPSGESVATTVGTSVETSTKPPSTATAPETTGGMLKSCKMIKYACV